MKITNSYMTKFCEYIAEGCKDLNEFNRKVVHLAGQHEKAYGLLFKATVNVARAKIQLDKIERMLENEGPSLQLIFAFASAAQKAEWTQAKLLKKTLVLAAIVHNNQFAKTHEAALNS